MATPISLTERFFHIMKFIAAGLSKINSKKFGYSINFHWICSQTNWILKRNWILRLSIQETIVSIYQPIFVSIYLSIYLIVYSHCSRSVHIYLSMYLCILNRNYSLLQSMSDASKYTIFLEYISNFCLSFTAI